jgi:dipeptidyl aminopeptidase/acylaminoacyl peptidase
VEVKVRQADGDWKTVAEYGWFTPKVITPRFIDRDRTLYVEALNGDKVAVFTMDKASGRLSDRPIAASNDFDLHPAFIANDLKLLGLRYLIDAEITQWLDPDLKALQDKIDAILPATANRIDVPRHGDSPWVLVQAFADVQPTVTYAFNRQTARLLLLGRSRPTIERRQMGQTDFIRYKARDGLAIPAYLTLPPGGVKKNLPLVVLVHGGPWSRGATWHWDAEVQFLASRSYAVLQPEFRGSTGFGARHFAAGFREWGRAMQDDIADGARWAIAQSIADPKRICIAGASYGGYATLMGLANDPDLYRCGIEWVGVTDIGLMFSVDWSDMTNEVKHFSLSRLIGDPKVDAERLDAVSPIRNADKIRQPLLMAYGEYDRRVPLVHGEKFRDAVKPHNSQVEWVVYPYEGHGWYRAETRIDFWNRVEKFLALHLGKP